MMRLSRCTVFIVATLLLSGCASAPQAPRTASAAPSFPPLSPLSLGKPHTATQVLRIAFAERETTLNCAVAVQADSMTVIGMTALGLRAFTIKYDGATVHAEAQPGVPDALAPERLLNDLQLVYWPLPALQKALRGTPWQVTEPTSGTRRLRRDGRLVAEVHYALPTSDVWQGRAWLVNLEFDYTLTIDSQLAN